MWSSRCFLSILCHVEVFMAPFCDKRVQNGRFIARGTSVAISELFEWMMPFDMFGKYGYNGQWFLQAMFLMASEGTSIMGHRNMYSTFQSSEMENDRDLNNTHPDPRLRLENGSFNIPVENAAVGVVNTVGSFNISLRSNDLPLGNYGSEITSYRAAHTRPPHGPYLPPSAGNPSRVPSNYIQHGPPYYNHFATGDMDYGRVPFKRKSPTFPVAFDGGSTSGYCSAGSSSSLHVSSNPLQSNPIAGPQFWPRDPASMVPDYRSNNLLVIGEGSQRNVRSRHSHTLPLSNPTRRISTANVSGPTVAGEWTHTPASLDSHGRIISSDRPLVGGSVGISGVEIAGGYLSNSISSRNPSTSLPTFHVPSTRVMGLGHSSHHGQRTIPHRALPSYRSMGFAAADGRRLGVQTPVPSRHSRPLSIIGRSGERIGRGRNFYDRLQPFSVEDNAHNRWGVAMMDRSALFDSRGFFDQHRDMRLDIDSMSYEELLALEERIGNVSTGLSEGAILKCLTEKIHSSDKIQDDEDENCIICLDEYKDGDGVGRLNCGHEFHFSCIKKWLLIKNACPICKAAAVEEE